MRYNLVTFIVLICFIVVFSTLGIYNFVINECRVAYTNGYFIGFYAGVNGKICNVGGKFETTVDGRKFYRWVGAGNEDYDEGLKRITGRKTKYWWAE